MATKKKLNKTVVVSLLVIASVLMLILAASAYKYRRKIFRKDPAVCVQKGQEALEKGDYLKAESLYGEGVIYAPKDANVSHYLYTYATAVREILNKATDLNTAQRRDLMTKYLQALRQTMLKDPKHLPAQKELVDYYWTIGNLSGNWIPFIDEASKLLKLEPNNDATWFRRATAYSILAKTVQGANIENAKQDFLKVIELKPNESSYRQTYIRFLLEQDMSDEALKASEVAVKALPDDPICVFSIHRSSRFGADLSTPGNKLMRRLSMRRTTP